MASTGTATVWGIDGTITHTGTARKVDVQGVTLQDAAQVDEFLNGKGQLLGFNSRDQRYSITIELYPKGATNAEARAGLTLPAVLSKVTLSGFADGAGTDSDLNGDWIYIGGGSKAWSPGQARLTLPIFRPLDLPSGVTVTTLTTAVT